MKWLLGAVLVTAVAWSSWWGISAWSQRQAVERWFEDRRADGWAASYDDLSIVGFPNRLDVTFEGLTLGDPEANVVWQAPFFQVLQMVYKTGHEILIFPPEQSLSTPDGSYRLVSDGLRASLVHDGDRVHRAHLEAAVLELTGAAGLALTGLTAAFEEMESPENTYRLAANAPGVAQKRADLAVGEGLGTDGARLDAVVTLDAPLRLPPPEGARPQPVRVDLRRAEYSLGQLELAMAGKVDVDGKGRMDGKVSVRAENWQALLDMAQDSGQLPPALADTLAAGLGMVAGLSGNRDRLDLPLDLDKGKMRLGPVPLGDAPRLRLP